MCTSKRGHPQGLRGSSLVRSRMNFFGQLDKKLNIIVDRLILIKLSKRIDRQCQYTWVCHSFGKNNIEEIWNAAYLPFWLFSFCSSRQILSISKNNYTGSMEKKYISLRHSVKLNGFFMVPQKCDTEEFLNAVYLPLEFSIIL